MFYIPTIGVHLDGARVKGTVGGVTTYYPNRYYEVAGGVVKKYYYAGANRIAMNDDLVTRTLLGDHLGSTAVTVAGTSELGEVRYRAFGATRFTSGTTPTTYRYTGQREESSFGLYYYGARWYDPALGRFVQADTIIPNAADARAYDRYAYVNNNPLRYNDPSGHQPNDPSPLGDDERPAGAAGAVKGSLAGNANALSADVAESASLPSATNNQLSTVRLPSTASNRSGEPTLETIVTTSDYIRGVSENQIGSRGVQQAAQIFSFEADQFRVRRPGEPDRVYDGRMALGPTDDESMVAYVSVIYVEVKTTTTKPSISLNRYIKQQIAFDAKMETKPMWIFVGAGPSRGLTKALNDAGIVWHEITPEQD